jgi:hypothetical protein
LENGIPFLSSEGQQWIASRTGESAPFQALCASAPASRMRHPSIHPVCFFDSDTVHLSSSRIGLPDRKVVEECLDMYSANPYKRIWPAIDAVLFRETIELAYNDRPNPCSVESAAAGACIFSFLSLLSLHHIYPKSMPSLDSEECAMRAYYLLPHLLHDTTLDRLQTCFMMVSCLTPTQRIIGGSHRAHPC